MGVNVFTECTVHTDHVDWTAFPFTYDSIIIFIEQFWGEENLL